MFRPVFLPIALALMTIVMPPFTLTAGADNSSATRHALKQVVEITAQGLGGLLSSVDSQKEQIQIVQAFIAPVRFFPDKSGYFYVYNTEGVCVAHATQPEIIGKSLYNMQDENGLYVIRHLITTAKNGGGFIEFNWQKPGVADTQDKLGYVQLIPGTELLIGSGIYFSSLK
ncbi:cache domain-containing protein [uncultured Pseudodesulfovibrio sp.]|uniref:cache domain-containing protein n=1 Tax=uncultured Pseudodesulfovibrio sp. TaxID=2035858 RepID=UPI0029C90C13|nr:cache domain-containing protein [uncultured Pseudodesulfovibrio sp.]